MTVQRKTNVRYSLGQMPLRTVTLSNAIEIANMLRCYFDKVTDEDVSEWHFNLVLIDLPVTEYIDKGVANVIILTVGEISFDGRENFFLVFRIWLSSESGLEGGFIFF